VASFLVVLLLLTGILALPLFGLHPYRYYPSCALAGVLLMAALYSTF
jgi:hypothetical protein